MQLVSGSFYAETEQLSQLCLISSFLATTVRGWEATVTTRNTGSDILKPEGSRLPGLYEVEAFGKLQYGEASYELHWGLSPNWRVE